MPAKPIADEVYHTDILDQFSRKIAKVLKIWDKTRTTMPEHRPHFFHYRTETPPNSREHGDNRHPFRIRNACWLGKNGNFNRRSIKRHSANPSKKFFNLDPIHVESVVVVVVSSTRPPHYTLVFVIPRTKLENDFF